MRLEVGHDGEDSIRALEGQVRGSKRNYVRGKESSGKEDVRGRSLGKVTCMWEDGVCLGIKATTGEFIAEREVRHVAHETVSGKLVDKATGLEAI